jgi:PAS domain S-box-containing protein
LTIDNFTASQVVDAAARAVESDPDDFRAALDGLPAAIYVTDREGTVTYFNEACIDAVGRTPQPGVDQWCVSWTLYTPEGEFLPHENCPMAVAIKQAKEVRGVEIVAERPDGTRARIVPYPTPLFDRDGALCGAVNLLVDITDQRNTDYLTERADQCRQLAAEVDDPHASEMLALMAAKYSEQARKAED